MNYTVRKYEEILKEYNSMSTDSERLNFHRLNFKYFKIISKPNYAIITFNIPETCDELSRNKIYQLGIQLNQISMTFDEIFKIMLEKEIELENGLLYKLIWNEK